MKTKTKKIKNNMMIREFDNGDKIYYKDDCFHRIDGPAIITKTYNAWYFNGTLHRLKEPALTYENGRKEWFFYGKRHNDYGPALIYEDGKQEWYINGELRNDHGPARIYANNTKEWYFNGELHREDGPAIIYGDCARFEWYINGKLHRIGKPAIIHYNQKHNFAERHKIYFNRHYVGGEEFMKPITTLEKWYINGKKHRDNGPAVTYSNGDKEWWRGKLHREDEPAMELMNGSKLWYLNGELHREDGPALELSDILLQSGSIYNGQRKKYYLYGKCYTPRDYDKMLKLNKNILSFSATKILNCYLNSKVNYLTNAGINKIYDCCVEDFYT